MNICRHCGNKLEYKFIDLVSTPPSNSFIALSELDKSEIYYPLKLYICDKCFLAQAVECKKYSEIFNSEYAYFSSYSSSWLKHAEEYVDHITTKIKLGSDSLVAEIASNDGYLLQYFKKKNIDCYGIEPSKNTSAVAKQKGIEVIEEFFGVELAYKLASGGKKVDLLLGNNVLAHVPNINDFVAGLKALLKDDGIITMEFPHILNMIKLNQFDTIYHEHFSYFSLYTVKQIFEKFGLKIFDVDTLNTHGGSLRIYASHIERENQICSLVNEVIETEIKEGITNLSFYMSFQDNVKVIKLEFMKFLIEQKICGKQIIAYGAAAKGNTFLNYLGVKSDLISFVVDASPYKVGKFLPGSRIEVKTEDIIREMKPDFIVILPWNLKEEIRLQLSYTKEWGGKFVTAIPALEIF